MKTKSKYATKRGSGNMMYGPIGQVPKVPQWHNPHVPKNQYWWGEYRNTKQSEAKDEE